MDTNVGGYIILIYTFGTHPAYTISNGWQLISNLLLGCVYLSIRVVWSSEEIPTNFAVVNQYTESYDIKYTA